MRSANQLLVLSENAFWLASLPPEKLRQVARDARHAARHEPYILYEIRLWQIAAKAEEMLGESHE